MAWGFRRSTKSTFSAYSSVCMETRSPEPASDWQSAKVSWKGTAAAFGWNRSQTAELLSNLRFPSKEPRARARGEMARVLIVEDHAPDVYLVKEALRASGISFELTQINDGNAARIYLIDATAGGVPDLIFLDINLPKADGLEILRMIRSWPHLAHVPVAILTSSSSPEDKDKAYRLGANLYITKPVGLSEFLSAVGSAAKQLLTEHAAGEAATPS